MLRAPRHPVPAAVRMIAAGRSLRPVWENELGGLTFALGDGTFVKWAPASSGLDLATEAERLRWAAPYTPVPTVLDQGEDAEGSWLLTAALGGESAVSPRWLGRPRTAVAAIGEGLRAFHDALPADRCPFSWSVADRVAAARRGGGGEELEALAAQAPPDDLVVVCHGDACAPNTVLGPDGRWRGHLDLGSLGLADRWADLAVATKSVARNYGPRWTAELFVAYGVTPDPDRLRFYRRLWELT